MKKIIPESIGMKIPCTFSLIFLIVHLICLSPTFARAEGAVCISDIDHYYNIAVQQYNQGDYLNASKNFYVWYIGSYCRPEIDKGFLDNFSIELSILDKLVTDSMNEGRSRVLSTYRTSGGTVSGKGDAPSPSGRRMPYFPPAIRRR